MSRPDAAFETLLGRKATDGERQRLYRVRDTLGVKSTDSLWTLLLVLEYYLALYEKLPQRIEDAARVAVAHAKATAEAQAKAAAAEVKRALTAGVLATVNDIARAATLKDILKWVAMTVLTLSVVIMAVGRWAFNRGAGRGAGTGGTGGDAGSRAQGRGGVLGEHGGWATRLRPGEGGYASRHGHVLGARAIGPRWLVYRARGAGTAVPMAVGRPPGVRMNHLVNRPTLPHCPCGPEEVLRVQAR